MTREQAKLRIKNLTGIISYHNNLYYNQDNPEISDSEYDELMRELVNLEREFPEFKEQDSPTERIGGKPLEKFQAFKHPYRMLGLSNVINKQELYKFDERIRKDLQRDSFHYSVEYKLDGLAVELIYENGILKTGSTRGDGEIGEDITLNLKNVKNIPVYLSENIPGILIVRGEAVIHKSDFARLNEQRFAAGEKQFSNPRNAAAGSLRQLDPNIVAGRPIKFYAYQIIIENEEINFESHKQSIDWIKEKGLPVVDGRWVFNSINKVENKYQEISKIREKLDTEIDGLVIKIDEISIQDKLGNIARSPRWAVAYKFKAEETKTTLNDIDLQISRHGVLTPVAKVKPVKVGGVTVSSVTLHNKAEMQRLDIKLGDTIRIKRAGDVIPKIIEVDKDLRNGSEKDFSFPDFCPYCNTGLEEDENGIFVACPNFDCSGRKVQRIIYTISKPCFNMDGVGNEWVKTLFNKGIIQDTADLFALNKEDIVNLERMGKKSAENFINAISKAKKVPYENFINALGIKFVGLSLAKILAQNFKTFEQLKNAKSDYLLNINEIGPNIAESIVNFFNDSKNLDYINKIFKNGVEIIYQEAETKSRVLEGKTFLFTGTLSNFTRDKAKKIVEENSGKVLSGVSKKLDYLVVGEAPGSKVQKAEKYNVKIITEQEFLNMAGEK